MKNQDPASNSKSDGQQKPAETKTGGQQSAQDELDIPQNPPGQQRPSPGGQANDASELDDDEAAEFDGLVKRH